MLTVVVMSVMARIMDVGATVDTMGMEPTALVIYLTVFEMYLQ